MCAVSVQRKFFPKGREVESKTTSRTTANLAAKAKGDKSMPRKQEFGEDMYVNVLQVLCAWLDWNCRIRVLSDDVHIRHTKALVATLEYTKVIALGAMLSSARDRQ
jgi:hypothetical protein